MVDSEGPPSEQDTVVTDITKPVQVTARCDCFIVIQDPRKLSLVGKRIDLESGTTAIGRDPDNQLALDDPAVSRVHARIKRTADGCVVTDTSTNGTMVNDALIAEPYRLAHGDCVRFGSVVLKFLSGDNVETAYHEEVYQSIAIDFLTKLVTRKIFDDELSREVTRAHRHERPLSLVMVDVDHFKKVNDSHGHDAGDAVLKEIGRLLKLQVRESDLAARLGGEEMGIIMPETRLEDASALADRVRHRLAAAPIQHKALSIGVTASFGCAMLFEQESASDLYRRADERLYEAKNGGRNCVKW
jgi:two-component system, cell cycle response regulator